MNNPLRILQTLDRHLTAPAELTLFGRAALALGYPGSPAAFAATQDVDAILPLSWLAAEDENLDFWQAQQRTNAELEPEGLYLTHLVRELEVILTQMARGDENDLADIGFLLRQERLTGEQLRAAFTRARVPDVPEIQELFQTAQPKVLALAGAN